MMRKFFSNQTWRMSRLWSGRLCLVGLTLLLVAAALASAPAQAQDPTTALGDVAAQMQPGSWVELTTSNTAAALPNVADYQTRCAAPGVIRCYGFDDLTDLTTGHPRNLTSPTDSTSSRMYDPHGGAAKCTGGQCWALDTSIKASGASALRFEIPSNTGADTSGSFRLNFSDDFSQQIGAGEELYLQYRQRFSPEMLRDFSTTNGQRSGWKQSILGLGDRLASAQVPGGRTIAYSCTAEEMVFVQDSRYMGPSFYHGCGFWESMDYWPAGAPQVKMQHVGAPFCYYPDDPTGGCFRYVANEWMTFKVHVKIVRWGTVAGNQVRVWAAREGQPSVLIYDSLNSHPGGFPIHQTDAGSKYGKVWLLPYLTNKNPNESHAIAYTWYDELIISRNDIADPGADGPAVTTTPSPMGTLTSPPTSTPIGTATFVPTTPPVNQTQHIHLPLVAKGQDAANTTPMPPTATPTATRPNATLTPTTPAATPQPTAMSTATPQPTATTPPSGSVLGDVAAAMQPGTWAELTTNGLTNQLLTDSADYSYITQYSEDLVWHPATRQLLFAGGPHTGQVKFITYNAANNTWQAEPRPDFWNCAANEPWGLCRGHAYDHDAINLATGTFYYRHYNSAVISQYDITSKTWSRLPDTPQDAAYPGTCCGGLEYFPELNSLVLVVGAFGEVALFDLATNEWRNLARDLPMGSYTNFAEYNPVHKVMILGGGWGSGAKQALHKLDASGQITRLQDHPFDQLGSSQSIVTVDPVSGKYLVFGKIADQAHFYEYDVTTDTWTPQPATRRPPFFDVGADGPLFGTVATPISTHGVVLFLNYDGDKSKVYLYKHP